MLAEDCVVHEFVAGERFTVGPFQLATRSLAHFVPNVGVRLTVGDIAVAYTGDGSARCSIAMFYYDFEYDAMDQDEVFEAGGRP